ncbi:MULTISPECIES: YjiH family protein [Fusobacterium]|uniref:YjiH family protein n=1 Tax=Fusobacterium TaxID=848 RepID=UPI001F4FC63E|nr:MULTISPECIES: YjiH family protein [Fusobacterium]MCI7224459.1 YjiH family protein [Fusobacterium sp.]MDD7410884.1 YjiH family protein [Fusobacteriaceae bacterium]MDY5305312.1 YjiH family protein [Fusobacterium gastrosuis]MDY5713237.1 YjiH family protein [Fusobacterium gastrosuis]
MDKYTIENKLKFVCYSLIGIFLFFVPISILGKTTIPLDHIVSYILKIPYFREIYGIILVIIGAILPFYRKNWNKNITSTIFSVLKIFAIPFVIMAITKRGPEFLMNKDVIPFIFSKIVVPVITIVPIGAVFLALIINYGLMEFVGVFMRPIMKPIWKTPGRAAIDAVASFVGSYSVALLITNRVYKEGKYTSKEAVIIATGFSTVSATFMIIVAKTLDLLPVWNIYFWATVFVTFLVTAITARIYPISKKAEEYYEGVEGDIEKEITDNKFKVAFDEAMETCSKADGIIKGTLINLKDGLNLAFNIAPSLMAVGTLGIVIANHTPIFSLLAYILYPFTYISGYEEPFLVAKALSLGIAEMFLPAVLVTKLSFEVRMLVAITCVSEVLFFSASIPCMMATDIPISFKDYLVIWFERVVLSILISIPTIYIIKLFI